MRKSKFAEAQIAFVLKQARIILLSRRFVERLAYLTRHSTAGERNTQG